MKIDDIDAFVAAVRNQSISLAAESLQLTQPAITRRIQNLEEALGVELLDRNTKPMKPTAIGRRVYEQSRSILREIDALRELVANDSEPSGRLRLGVPQAISDTVLLEALTQLREHFPNLSTQVITGWGASLVTKVEHGELDAATVLFPSTKIFPEGISGTTLGRMPLVVVAAKHQFQGKRSWKLADCHTHGWVLNPDGCGFRAGLQRALSAQGLSLQVNMEAYGAELQLGLVANGMGLGLIPLSLLEKSVHRKALVIVPLSDFKPQIDIWLVSPHFLGNLQQPVELFGDIVAQRLGEQRGAGKRPRA